MNLKSFYSLASNLNTYDTFRCRFRYVCNVIGLNVSANFKPNYHWYIHTKHYNQIIKLSSFPKKSCILLGCDSQSRVCLIMDSWHWVTGRWALGVVGHSAWVMTRRRSVSARDGEHLAAAQLSECDVSVRLSRGAALITRWLDAESKIMVLGTTSSKWPGLPPTDKSANCPSTLKNLFMHDNKNLTFYSKFSLLKPNDAWCQKFYLCYHYFCRCTSFRCLFLCQIYLFIRIQYSNAHNLFRFFIYINQLVEVTLLLGKIA